MKKLLLIALLALPFAGSAQAPALIPQPVQLQPGKGTFAITPSTVIVARDVEDGRVAGMLSDYVKDRYGLALAIVRQDRADNAIRFNTRRFMKAPDKDAYYLQVAANGIAIEGDTYAGTFYGLQTLLQLLPPAAFTKPASVSDTLKAKVKPGKSKVKTQARPVPPAVTITRVVVPQLLIQDYPRFKYRGMHLDVSRHFFPVSFVKKYIDYLAAHKLNYFHWHLSDDQGWRIEIKKFPELVNTGSWRHGTIVGRYPGTGSDNRRYGGYYTQDEIREVVQYAAGRHISVIPEIDVPGHSSAAIASYPYLSCFPEEPTVIPSWPSEGSRRAQAAGRPKQVQETFGVFNDIMCAGKDSTFLFMEGVIDELVALFPEKYVHMGGDEAPKSNWKRCPHCQARMKAEGLKDEHELQSYFMRRLEKHINARGRTMMGWDEILEGGLAPNAVVMSWQGERGGIEAAKQQHYAVMTPGKPLYFDHSQTRTDDSLVWGGFNPLDSVYAYEPIPAVLDSAAARYIVGAQANLWTEYVSNPAKVEYMIFPRMSALSEVLWSPKEARNWPSFRNRLLTQFGRYAQWGASYSKAFYDLRGTLAPGSGNARLHWILKRVNGPGTIVYEGGGAVYNTGLDSVVVPITREGTYRAYTVNGTPFFATAKNKGVAQLPMPRPRARIELTPSNNPTSLTFRFSKATGKKVTLAGTSSRNYPGQGAFSLVNGIWSAKGLSYPDWLGFLGGDVDATIDLGSSEPISTVRVHTIVQEGSWVYAPEYLEVHVSDDGGNFRQVGRSSAFTPDTLTMRFLTLTLPAGTRARYVRVLVKNYGLIPEGKPGGGTRSWAFADEILID
ncbi:glycoside hydrolase family 20 protein [Flaviaesturariibacter amylovorans]|uniref:beta-N-acetylhexosaminidase n=1 Tax=Flaviaesturariibacter amylovorans TaxID=1084520 RepID=A0ABP8GUR4_9BACT